MAETWEAIKDFLQIVQNSNNTISIPPLVVSVLICLIFFTIKACNTYRKKEEINWTDLMLNIIVSCAISSLILLIVGTNGVIVASPLGITLSLKLTSILIKADKEVSDNSKDDDTEEETHKDINITINNANENNNTVEEELVPSYFHPTEIELPDGVSINQLDIISILEMYGYISQNQKFKMVTDSLFECTDEQVRKLLSMHVLTDHELKEAYAILNLIKLKNKLIGKEEALNYIMKMEERNEENKFKNK